MRSLAPTWPRPGDRVTVAESTGSNGTRRFGHGVYVGHIKLPQGVTMGPAAYPVALEGGWQAPCAVLDSGAIVWSFQGTFIRTDEWSATEYGRRPCVEVDPPRNPVFDDASMRRALAVLGTGPTEADIRKANNAGRR